MSMRVVVTDNSRVLTRMLRENGQYLVTVHNGNLVKLQKVDKGAVLTPGVPVEESTEEEAKTAPKKTTRARRSTKSTTSTKSQS